MNTHDISQVKKMFIDNPNEVIIEVVEGEEYFDPPIEFELSLEDSTDSTDNTDNETNSESNSIDDASTIIKFQYNIYGKDYTYTKENPSTFTNPFWKLPEHDERYIKAIKSNKPIIRGIIVEEKIRYITSIYNFFGINILPEQHIIYNTKERDCIYYSSDIELFKDNLKYFIVDYIGVNLLFEIKSIENDFYSDRLWVPLTTTKFNQNTSFRLNCEIKENGEKIVKNIFYKEKINKKRRPEYKFHECLIPGEYKYYIIYVMKDGIFIYNILTDTDVVITEDGMLECPYELYFENYYKIPKNKLIPIDQTNILSDYVKMMETI